jgi:protein angel
VYGTTTADEASTSQAWTAPGTPGGLRLPFLANNRKPSTTNVINTNPLASIDTGRRFFARFSAPQSIAQSPTPIISTEQAWRQSQSEDTYDLDENILELLSMDPNRLPKPCDPLTYCFWEHGMRRQFEPVSSSSLDYSFANSTPQLTFTVCSYNVLCQRTLNLFLEQLYSHCAFEHLTWQRRWPMLAVEFRMLDSDIFCMQEVQYDHFEQDYLPFFSKLGYDGTFKKKLKKKSDGCATFWRRDKFRPVQVQPIEYSFPAPHDHSDCVALITVLEPTNAKCDHSVQRVIVANTHLIYQPALGATKLCQAALLLAHLQKMSRRYSSAPLIVCGDFNSTPFSPLYSLMVEGELKYSGLNGWSVSGQQQSPSKFRRLNAIGDAQLCSPILPEGSECSERCTLVDSEPTGCDQSGGTTATDLEPPDPRRISGRLSHSLNLRSVYDHTTKSGEPEVSMFVRDQSAAVDYIFYSVEDKEIRKTDSDLSTWTKTNVKENGLRCLERYRLPGPTQLNRTIGYLPNQYCASDHLPLMAKFALDAHNE